MIGHELNNLADQSDYIVQIYKNKLKPGDIIIIRTMNSTYSIKVADDGSYIVSGGWFDKKNLSPSKIK